MNSSIDRQPKGNATDNELNINSHSQETIMMNTQQASIWRTMKTTLLQGALILAVCSGLQAQESTVENDKGGSEKFSIGIESGMSFNMFRLDSAQASASGNNPYVNVNGSYAVTDRIAVQMSVGYEELKWSTSRTGWDLPGSPEIRDIFYLPDSLGSFTSPTQSMSVTAPSVNLSASVRYNPISWIGMTAGFTTQMLVNDATVCCISGRQMIQRSRLHTRHRRASRSTTLRLFASHLMQVSSPHRSVGTDSTSRFMLPTGR
jgi:hypothetical protein